MELMDKAKGKRTKNPEQWRKSSAFTLGQDDRDRMVKLAKHHGVAKSVLLRYLLLQEEAEIEAETPEGGSK